jgi:hypothetical protein
MGRNYLKGRSGDTHHALLAGMGFNLMLLLSAWAGNFWLLFFGPLGWLGLRREARLEQTW